MKKRHLAFALLFCCANLLFSQTPSRIAGQIIVQVNPGTSVESLLATAQRSLPKLRLERAVAPSWDIYLLGFEEDDTQSEAVLDAVQHLSGVRFAQWNALVQDRSTTPNDPNWGQQSDMTLIHAPEVWDASTGGLTPSGDTIVVAILEKLLFRFRL